MQRIVEQARQTPINATPIGWSDGGVVFPKVNTCLTITSIAPVGPAIGLHLGMFMDDTGPHSAMPSVLPKDHLTSYLNVMEKHVGVKQTMPIRIYIAGCVWLWQSQQPGLWTVITKWAEVTAAKYTGTVKPPMQFDDRASYTVDIEVTGTGVKFYKPDTREEVAEV